MPPASFRIDPSGGPIYAQLAEQIKRSIAVGLLAPGERLPAIAALATQLTVNPNTVARVYRELEQEGVISTFVGRGSFVNSADAVGASRRAARDVAIIAFANAVREAKSVGLTRADVTEIAGEAIARHYPEETQ